MSLYDIAWWCVVWNKVGDGSCGLCQISPYHVVTSHAAVVMGYVTLIVWLSLVWLACTTMPSLRCQCIHSFLLLPAESGFSKGLALGRFQAHWMIRRHSWLVSHSSITGYCSGWWHTSTHTHRHADTFTHTWTCTRTDRQTDGQTALVWSKYIIQLQSMLGMDTTRAVSKSHMH